MEMDEGMSGFDLQTVAFWNLKNARSIAETVTFGAAIFIKSGCPQLW
jgi:hypothetical protein